MLNKWDRYISILDQTTWVNLVTKGKWVHDTRYWDWHTSTSLLWFCFVVRDIHIYIRLCQTEIFSSGCHRLFHNIMICFYYFVFSINFVSHMFYKTPCVIGLNLKISHYYITANSVYFCQFLNQSSLILFGLLKLMETYWKLIETYCKKF